MTSPDDPGDFAEEGMSGVRAARLRLKLSQRQLAELMQRPMETVQNWDRGHNRPSKPADLLLLSMHLKTPLEVLFPPDPEVAQMLDDLNAGDDDLSESSDAASTVPESAPAWRGQPATTALRDQNLGAVGDDLLDPFDAPSMEPEPALTGRPQPAIAAALRDQEPDHVDAQAPASPARGRGARVALAAVASLAVVVAVAIAVSLESDDRGTLDGDSAAASGLTQQADSLKVEMRSAADRRDFDRAIVLARRVGDPVAASRFGQAAAGVLVRRAAQAAKRGDLPLARSRLRSAQRRYGDAPGARAVKARIGRVERDRRRRAEQQRRREREREQAAAARRASAASAPVTRPAAPTSPSPSSVAPQSGSSGQSSGATRESRPRESEQAVDPGLF